MSLTPEEIATAARIAAEVVTRRNIPGVSLETAGLHSVPGETPAIRQHARVLLARRPSWTFRGAIQALPG